MELQFGYRRGIISKTRYTTLHKNCEDVNREAGTQQHEVDIRGREGPGFSWIC